MKCARGRRWLRLSVIVGTVLVCVLGAVEGPDAGQDGGLEVKIEVGRAWKNRKPQVAVWMTDAQGKSLLPVYATRWGAERFQRFESLDGLPRPEALPVFQWALYTSGRRQDVDGVSGASPLTSFAHRFVLPEGLKKGKYLIWAEINQSFNYNDYYRKDLPVGDPGYNATSGQPSMVFRAELELNRLPAQVELEYVGHGHPAGRDGLIVIGTQYLSTAMDLVQSIEVHYTPAPADGE